MIAIVTDSTSDIPAGLARKLNIHIVPAVVVIDGESYEDGTGLSRKDFYTRLPSMKTPPTTAAPSSGRFETMYKAVFESGADQIISIHPPDNLTALSNVAMLAAKSFGGRVHVVDSRQITLGLGFQVLAAAEAAAGGANLKEIVRLLEDTRRRIRLFAMLDTLEYLRRSGRVSFVRAVMGAMLRMRLVIKLKDGQVIPVERVRTRRKSIAYLENLMWSQGEFERFAMLHTNAAEDARQFIEKNTPKTQSDPMVINVTTVIGTHVGPHALGFVGVLSETAASASQW